VSARVEQQARHDREFMLVGGEYAEVLGQVFAAARSRSSVQHDRASANWADAAAAQDAWDGG